MFHVEQVLKKEFNSQSINWIKIIKNVSKQV